MVELWVSPVGVPSRRWWHSLLERRPELLALTAAAVAWVALLTLLLAPDASSPSSSPPHDHAAMHGTGPPADGELLSEAGRGALLWVMMVVAMMLPLAVPGIRYVARMVPRRGRLGATSTFAAAYVVVWLPGVAVVVAVHGQMPSGWPVVATAFLLAAAWELTPAKRTALLRCHRRHVVRAGQPARRRTCLVFGLRRGGWCVVSCGPAMLALMVGHHALVALIVLAVGAAVQQFSPDAHWHRRWSAAGLGVLAVSTPWLT